MTFLGKSILNLYIERGMNLLPRCPIWLQRLNKKVFQTNIHRTVGEVKHLSRKESLCKYLLS